MPSNLTRKAHEPRFILQISLGIVLAATAISALLLSLFSSRNTAVDPWNEYQIALVTGEYSRALQLFPALQKIEQTKSPDEFWKHFFERTIPLLPHSDHPLTEETAIREHSQFHTFILPLLPRESMEHYWNGLLGSREARENYTTLLALSQQPSPPPDAALFAGELAARHGLWEEALHAYELALETSSAHSAQKKIIAILLQRRDFDTLTQLSRNPDFSEAWTVDQRVQWKIAQRQWLSLFPLLVTREMNTLPLGMSLLATLAGTIWFSTLLLLGQWSQRRRGFLPLCLLALLAGALSAIATLIAIYWQKEVWHLQESGQLANDLVYFIAGVGLREEIVKLLFFLPFTPILLRRNDGLEALLVASCVGLGFAILENVQYYQNYSHTVAISRLLTANFFHLAATGILGWTTCQLLARPRREIERWLITLVAVIAIHGVYNSLLAIPALQEYGLFAFTAFILLSYGFFHTLRQEREKIHSPLPLRALFCWQLALLAGVLLGATWWLGEGRDGYLAMAYTWIEFAPIVIFFWREIGDA